MAFAPAPEAFGPAPEVFAPSPQGGSVPVAAAPTTPTQPETLDGAAEYLVSDSSALSREELLDLPTTLASKREERTSDASATVTGYTARDLEALGEDSLYELADFTAVNHNEHLVYLNGIPISHARSYKKPADRELHCTSPSASSSSRAARRRCTARARSSVW